MQTLSEEWWEDRQAAWRRHIQATLDGLRAGLRAKLWDAVGLSEPLGREQLVPWLLERVPPSWDSLRLRLPATPDEQSPLGDRLRLYLPADLARGEAARQGREAADPQQLALVLIRRDGRRYFIDVFAGRYLDADLADPAAQVWPGVGPVRRSFRQRPATHPALVALAVREVQRVTGSTAEGALLFLLCDEPCGRHFHLSFRLDGGLRVWAWDPMMPAKELMALFVAQRRSLIPQRNRAKAPGERTARLIDLVREMRPHPGRHPGNAPWPQVLERWNAEHPEHKYADKVSVSKAWLQAARRRKRIEDELRREES